MRLTDTLILLPVGYDGQNIASARQKKSAHSTVRQRRVVQRRMFQVVIIAQIPGGLKGVFSGALIDETVAEPGS